jgi:hypothetical protein
LTPPIFSSFGNKHQKAKKKKKESTNSLLVLLDIIPVDILATTSPAAICDCPSTTVVIVVRVDMGSTLSVSSSGVVSGTGGTPQLLSLTVTLQGLLPIYCLTLLLFLLLLLLIIII